MKHIRLTDVTLRDGMHAVRHQFSLKDAREITAALDASGVDIIEATHGDGLAGSSIQYGMAKEPEEQYLRTVCETAKNTKVAALLLPGIGTLEELKRAADCGIRVVRVATHSTEADIAEEHISEARKMGLETVGFLMMSHMTALDILVQEAQKMESYGAQCVYVVDSAGAMLMDEVRQKIAALRHSLSKDTEVGFHGHNNLGCSIPNSLGAIEEGAVRIDVSLAGLGAGAGNTPSEAFVAVCTKLGVETGTNLYAVLDAAEDIVRPKMHQPILMDSNSIMLGYAGVYSSFLLHAARASEQFDIDIRDILVELGNMRIVGGQEDVILDVAYRLAHGHNQESHVVV